VINIEDMRRLRRFAMMAQGSLELANKQLRLISSELDEFEKICYDESMKGEEDLRVVEDNVTPPDSSYDRRDIGC